MDPQHLLPGVLVVELTLVYGVEGGGHESRLYLGNRHIVVHTHLLHVNVHGNKLQKERLIVGFTSRFSASDLGVTARPSCQEGRWSLFGNLPSTDDSARRSRRTGVVAKQHNVRRHISAGQGV